MGARIFLIPSGHGCPRPNACFSRILTALTEVLGRDLRANDPRMSAGCPFPKLTLWADFFVPDFWPTGLFKSVFEGPPLKFRKATKEHLNQRGTKIGVFRVWFRPPFPLILLPSFFAPFSPSGPMPSPTPFSPLHLPPPPSFFDSQKTLI